jgi:HEPN domain-containing protein/predicted nucleotidyltransferase
MKTSLGHLPTSKREAISKADALINEFEQVSMVFLFGSYARGDYVEDPVGNDEDGNPYFSDLDICVLVDKGRKARRIERSSILRKNLRAATGMRVQLVAHTVKQFNKSLESGEFFYVDIAKEGIQLSNPGNVVISQPKNLTEEERQAKAREDFDYWMERSDKMLKHHRIAMEDDDLREAAFFLHQTAEHALAAACLVLSGYRPKGHDLAELEDWCAQFDPTFRDIFPKATSEDDRLFELLNKAYVGARYRKSFTVSREDLDVLQARVAHLRDATNTLTSSFPGCCLA